MKLPIRFKRIAAALKGRARKHAVDLLAIVGVGLIASGIGMYQLPIALMFLGAVAVYVAWGLR